MGEFCKSEGAPVVSISATIGRIGSSTAVGETVDLEEKVKEIELIEPEIRSRVLAAGWLTRAIGTVTLSISMIVVSLVRVRFEVGEPDEESSGSKKAAIVG